MRECRTRAKNVLLINPNRLSEESLGLGNRKCPKDITRNFYQQMESIFSLVLIHNFTISFVRSTAKETTKQYGYEGHDQCSFYFQAFGLRSGIFQTDHDLTGPSHRKNH